MKNKERDGKIIKWRSTGSTLATISRVFNLSSARVRQITVKHARKEILEKVPELESVAIANGGWSKSAWKVYVKFIKWINLGAETNPNIIMTKRITKESNSWLF